VTSANPDRRSLIDLAEQIAADAVSVRRDLRVYKYLTGLLILTAIIAAVMGVGIYRAVSASRDTLVEVRSCTDPAGACAQRGRANTDAAVQRLVAGFARVIECSRLEDPAAWRACVRDQVGVDLTQPVR
jgi:hypothetical protein